MAEKIVIIGAGSMEFTPSLIAQFISRQRYHDAIFALVDIDEERLGAIRAVTEKYLAAKGISATVLASTDRRALLSDADIVVAAIATGGMRILKTELDIPAKYGYIQHGGDTLGPSGIVRALRHIPPMIEIGRDVRRLCPRARFYNLTNPLTAITYAVRRYSGANAIGLCMGSVHTAEHFCRTAGIGFEGVEYTVAGINHCTWVLNATKDGQDLYPLLDAQLQAIDFSKCCHDTPAWPDGAEVTELCADLYRRFGLYPGPGDGHVSEFFPEMIQSTPERRAKYAPFDRKLLRWMLENQSNFADALRGMAEGERPFDAALFDKAISHGDSQITDIESALHGEGRAVINMNFPNGGALCDFPADAIVEIPVVVDGGGFKPLHIGRLPACIVPRLSAALANCALVSEAAMEGSAQKAVQALWNDPSCMDPDAAERCILEMIHAEKACLPNFV